MTRQERIEFGAKWGWEEQAIAAHMKKGYCNWPRRKKDRDTKHPHYNAWLSMKRRCYLKTHEAYARYGGAGIDVCPRWRVSFEDFLEDMGPALPDYTLDRIDNSKGYNKENCRWASRLEQTHNRKNINKSSGIPGIQKIHNKWAVRIAINKIYTTLGYFYTLEEAIDCLQKAR